MLRTTWSYFTSSLSGWNNSEHFESCSNLFYLLKNFYDKYMWFLHPVKLFSLNKSCMYSITQLINLYNLSSVILLIATTSYNNVVSISYAHTLPISCSKQRIKAIKTTSLTFKNQFSINHKPWLFFTRRKWMSLETWPRMDSWRVGRQGRTRRQRTWMNGFCNDLSWFARSFVG